MRPDARLVTSNRFARGLESLISCSTKLLPERKSLLTKASKLTKQAHPIIQSPMKEKRNNLLLVLILASLRINQVIIPITGTAIKNTSVPQASRFCHPSVSTKSFNGKMPIENTASANKATTNENPIALYYYTASDKIYDEIPAHSTMYAARPTDGSEIAKQVLHFNALNYKNDWLPPALLKPKLLLPPALYRKIKLGYFRRGEVYWSGLTYFSW